MNWDAIGAIGEIVGASAVVVSLVYLASQLRQSNEIARQSAYREFQSAFDDISWKASSEPELHKLWRDALYEQKPVSDIERERLAFLFSRAFGAFNVAYHSSRRDPEFRAFVNDRLEVWIANPVIRGWWRRQRMQHPNPFRSLVDARIKKIDAREDAAVEKSA